MGSLIKSLAAAVLLLVGASSFAASRTAELCAGDGAYHQTGYCPASLYSPGYSSVTTSSANCLTSSTQADGTQYFCVTNTSTPLSAANVVACSGGAAVVGGSQSVTASGQQARSMTGLSAGTTYYCQSVNLSPEGWYSNVATSVALQTPSGGAAPEYDLYGTDSNSRGTIPFAVNWPAKPSTLNGTYSVTNTATFATALGLSGYRIEVSAGSYAAIVPTTTDQHWVLADNAIVSGLSISAAADRITIEGGQINSGANNIEILGDDVLLKNVNIDTNSLLIGRNAYSGNPRLATHRTALVHVTAVCDRYCVFVPSGAAGVDAKSSDVIVAGSLLYGGQLAGNSGVESTVRIMYNDRFIGVDNRIKNGIEGQGIKNTWRSHYATEDYWLRRNLTEYGDGIYFAASGGTGDPGIMGSHYVYDHLHYRPSSNPNSASSSGFRRLTEGFFDAGLLTAVDNTAYDSRTAGSCVSNVRWFWNAQSGDTISNNRECPYQAPPALGSWLTADGTAPGADH